jgi:hypothetical protein
MNEVVAQVENIQEEDPEQKEDNHDTQREEP